MTLGSQGHVVREGVDDMKAAFTSRHSLVVTSFLEILWAYLEGIFPQEPFEGDCGEADAFTI